ncbi:MAG: hypothetical protein E7158_03915 [Firmicutes bacterium]|nr:hypothetical protein [Bacillota bacterium]
MKCLNYICTIDDMGEVNDILYQVNYYLFEEVDCSEEEAIKLQEALERKIRVEERKKEVANNCGIYQKNYYLNVRKSKDNSLFDSSDSYIKKDEDIKKHLSKRGFDVISIIDPSEYIKFSNKTHI